MAEEDIQVEVIPELPEEKPRMKGGDTATLDVRDDEIAGYGREVQQRIRKLRFAFHEERRLREQAQRDSTTANSLAQRPFQENGERKKSARAGEQAVVHQALTRVNSEIAQARASLAAAHSANAVPDIVASQEKLARAVAEKERLDLIKSS